MKFKQLHIYNWFLLLLISIFIISCNNNDTDERPTIIGSDGIEVSILQSAGELYKTIKFLPLPANVATFEGISPQDLECWIISERIKESKEIDVDIFAMIIYKDGTLDKHIILSIPSEEDFQTIKTSDLMDFSVKHSGLKNILESWLKQYKGIKSSIYIQWKDKQEALRYLQKFEKKRNENND